MTTTSSTSTTTFARRAPRLAAALAATGLAVAAVAGPAGASTGPSRPAPAADQAGNATGIKELKQTARQVVKDLAEGKTRTVGRNFAAGYVDHGSPDDTGSFGLTELARRTRAQHQAHPEAEAVVYRVMGQGNTVFVHSNLILDPGTRGWAVMDVYRFDDSGRIVEHWTGRQAVPATTVSGNDMFSTVSSPHRLSPDPKADPAASAQVVINLFTSIAVNRSMDNIDQFIQAPYYQHSINTGNGTAALRQVWGPLLLDPATHVSLVNFVADGDLVVAQNRLDNPRESYLTFDISRVRNGMIVEHWDVVHRVS